MDLFQAVILGIVQGIAEWLPISSEGVNSLILVYFFNSSLTDAVYLSIWLHSGTLLAAVVFFRKQILKLLKNLRHYSFKETPYNNLTNFLVASTIVTGIIGLPILLFGLDKLDFNGNLATAFIGILLIITGFLQLFIKNQTLKKLPTTFDGILAGFVQPFAGLPGLSRSGLTVSVLIFRGYNPETALSLSFLMSIPAVFGAEIVLILLDKVTFSYYLLLAMVFSFIIGLFTLNFLTQFAKKFNFGYFCILLGLISFTPLIL